MKSLVQIVPGGFGSELRPQGVDGLLTVKAMVGRQGEQLDQQGRPFEAPLTVVDGSTSDLDAEAP